MDYIQRFIVQSLFVFVEHVLLRQRDLFLQKDM
jgi:hypothetical protein